MKMYRDMFMRWLGDNGYYDEWLEDRNDKSIYDCASIRHFYYDTVIEVNGDVEAMWSSFIIDTFPYCVLYNIAIDVKDMKYYSIVRRDYSVGARTSSTNDLISIHNGNFHSGFAGGLTGGGNLFFPRTTTTTMTKKIAKLLNTAVATKRELRLPKYLDVVFSVESLTNLIEGSKDENE